MMKMQMGSNGEAASGGAGAQSREHTSAAARSETEDVDDFDDFVVSDDFGDDPYGFTEDEILELASQGIKPCDPEAREILDLLHSNDSAAGDK